MVQKMGADANRESTTQLTPSEQRIWDLHLQGMTRKQIAEALGLKPATVGGRMRTAREKVSVR